MGIERELPSNQHRISTQKKKPLMQVQVLREDKEVWRWKEKPGSDCLSFSIGVWGRGRIVAGEDGWDLCLGIISSDYLCKMCLMLCE